MQKKNKKVSPAPKPVLVLSRRAIAGWLVVVGLICGWMFGIGVIVGRDESPVKFDINALQKELEPFRDPPGKADAGQTPHDSVDEKADLDFYEALPENREDADITAKPSQPELPAQPEPPAREAPIASAPSIKKPAAKVKTSMKRMTRVRPAETDSAAPAKPPPAASESPGKAAGGTYTIQVAAFREAGDADKLVAQLNQKGYRAYRAIGKVPGQGIWYRVRVGEYHNSAEAAPTLAALRKAGKKPVLVEK